jgi:Prenyltransferase and squalene oxidase repeat
VGALRMSSMSATLRTVLDPVRRVRADWRLPESAKAERRRDSAGGSAPDPGIDRAIDEAIGWLCRAQDRSASHDGGVARHFSLIHGWSNSYPETTGYIIPTLLACADLRNDDGLRLRAKRMLDWLVAIQLPSGGFQGGTIGATPVAPVTFNTGQILMGLAHGVRVFGDRYRPAMRAAADWLIDTQDADGCWRRHASPFAQPGEKTYETHVAWGLLEASRIEPGSKYADAALTNVGWALRQQRDNGWFEQCCLSDPTQPLTHTLGYVLRGVVEAYRYTRDRALLDASRRTADGLLTALRADGSLPGRLDSSWRGTVEWACLTGSVQIAHCWLMLHQDTGEARYKDAASAANRFVRRTIRTDGPEDTRGGVKGSFPVDGDYGKYEYLNWACKFFIDSNLLEKTVSESPGP